MLLATKTVRFDAAHVLTGHKGLCRNLHGHTYRVDVTVRQEPGDGGDMVIDFKELKRIVEDAIVSRFDHAFIYDATSPVEREIAAVVERAGMRTVRLPFRSTAENLARRFHETLAPRLPSLASVRVHETPDSCAEYAGEGTP